MFDLTLFPLSLDAGQEQHELPGLLITPAPRKTARMRSQDILILLMRLATPAGEVVTLTAAQQQEMLNRLAETYYKTPGSVTAGLRAVVTRLNDFLFSRNLRAGQGGQRIGSLNLAVLHGDVLILAHGGPSHSFFLDKNGVRHFDDAQSLRGLGLSRQAVPRFYQTELAINDILIFCPDPPPTWGRTLGSAQNLTLDHLRRRLLGEAGTQLQAAVLRFTSGKGQVNFWRPSVAARTPTAVKQVEQAPQVMTTTQDRPADSSALKAMPLGAEPAGLVLPEHAPGDSNFPAIQEPPDDKSEIAVETEAADIPAAEPAAEEGQTPLPPEEQVVYLGAEPGDSPAAGEAVPLQPRPPVRDRIEGSGDSTARAEKDARPADQPDGIRLSRAVGRAGRQVAELGPAERRALARAATIAEKPAAASSQATTPAHTPGPAPSERLRRALAPAWHKGGAARARLGGAIAGLFAKLFPKQSEPVFNVSPSAMLMIAIIVPFIIGTIGTVVYFRLGRTERFDTLFTQAQQYAAQASQLSEPALQREGWKRVLEMVGEAENYGSSDESTALSRQALDILDGLEGYVRLDYRPVSGSGFGPDVNITRIIAKLNQVYLLDSSQGRILSMTRTTTGGYEVNSFFNCGPGKAGGAYIGPLIDLAELPVNNELNAEILGIDAGGNLVYCASNKTGYDSRPLAFPDAGWGEIAGIATYNDILYVLDPKANAVYWYSGERGTYADSPHLYFDEGVPFMADVIDLAIDQEFLYLLHEDGRMTVCSSGGVSFATTRCTDPAPYGDGREGYEPSPLIFPGTNFTHIQTTQPPDPSLFALDRQNISIYHLSQRRMNLQRQYRPLLNTDYPLPRREPTAFAITPNRRVVLVFGNEVFFASLP